MSGQRMDAVRRVTDQRQARCDGLRDAHQAQREGGGRGDLRQLAEFLLAGGGDTVGERLRRERQQFVRVRIGRRPDDGDTVRAGVALLVAGEWQPGEYAVVAEPLSGDAAMRLLALEVGDDAHLPIRRVDRLEAGRLAHPRVASVGTDNEFGGEHLSVVQRQAGNVRGEGECLRRGGTDQREVALALDVLPQFAGHQ